MKDRVPKSAPAKIGDLFEIYKKRLRPPQGSVVDAAIDVVDDIFGFTLEKRHLSYAPQTKILTLKVSGMIKTEILLRKEEVLTHLKGRLGTAHAPKTIL